jgi:hypothetical protein
MGKDVFHRAQWREDVGAWCNIALSSCFGLLMLSVSALIWKAILR